METRKAPQIEAAPTRTLRSRLHLTRARIYYWPIRTIVQFAFFILFSGVGIMSLDPAFNGTRSWIVLPIVPSVYSQAQVTSTLDATTVLLRDGLFPWLPVGIMLVVGAILGRFMCGWICPVGFLQDVITTVKGRVDSVEKRAHVYWIRLKYVLVVLAFLISGTLGLAVYYGSGGDYKNSLGPFADGVFVAITPDGTLFGTLPMMLAGAWSYLTTDSSALTFVNISKWIGSVSAITWLNIIILVGFVYAAWRIPRFWCRYVCPVGAIMAVTQKNSLLGMHRDPIKCSDCKECETACPMQIPILDLDWKKFNDSECILCMACIDACPAGALSPKFP